MKARELIGAWSLTARGPLSWLAYCANETDADALARACAATLARPMEPEEVMTRLLNAGEFDAAELLMQESSIWIGVDAEVLREMESNLKGARGAAVEEIQAKLANIRSRAATLHLDIDHSEIIQATGRQRSAGADLLEQYEHRVEEAEAAVVERLRTALANTGPAGLDETAYAEWRVNVEHAISLGALEAARAEIEMGPSLDRPPLVGVPSAPVWPYRSESLHFVVDWMFGDGVIPPGFERYRPDVDDAEAWELLKALREASVASEAVLSGLARVLGSKLASVDVRRDGVLGRLENLGAPGFHAFSPLAWPSGIPIWLPAGDFAARPDEVEDRPLIEVAVGAGAGDRQRVVRLDVHNILAVLRDRKHRRARLLAQLGRQLPLEYAFAELRADAAARWERSDIPSGLTSGERPVLLVGAPGMGKSTLLLEFAEAQGKTAAIVSATEGGDLPEADPVLIDGVDCLEAEALRALMRDVHWIRTTRTPPPHVLVTARPENVAAIEHLAKNMFEVIELPPRSSAALREQARTMLGWVGVEATSPGSYDSLAFLAHGNPTVLFLLCRALTKLLARESTDHRRFTPRHVEAAWQDPEFRALVQELLWAPLQSFDGALDILQVLVDLSDPPEPLARDDFAWLINERLGERDPDWVGERLSLLRRYGLVREVQGRFVLRLGGTGTLVRTWLDERRRNG